MEHHRRPTPRDGQQNSTPAANDEPLLDAVRNGDNQAFGELYERHRGAVFAVARLHTHSQAEAEDITSEAFTRVLALLKSGGGPRQFLRAYLVTAVSRLAADRANDLNRTQPQEPQEQGKLDRVQLFDDTLVRQVDAAVVARAFASLPERWQEVLWYLEIEGYRPRQVASAVGMQPNAVSALGKRARDGLRTAYMQQHVSAQALEECGEYSAQLGAFVRGTLTPSKMKLMQDHLDSCERCTAEYLQLQDLGVGLRGWILPILAGLPLWGDASERLIAALGTAGAGGAAGVSGWLSGTTAPLGAGAEGASVPAVATATSVGSAGAAASGAVATTAAGGFLAGSATKVILAAAGVALAGAGTAGIVTAVQPDSSEVEITRQAQPATDGPAGVGTGEGASTGDTAGGSAGSADGSSDVDSGGGPGSSAGSDTSDEAEGQAEAGGNGKADPPTGDSGGRQANAGADKAEGESNGGSDGKESDVTGAPLGAQSPSVGGERASGEQPGDVLAGTGALLPPYSDRDSGPDSSSSRDTPSGIDMPSLPGDTDIPQLEVPFIPTLPGPELPLEPPVSEDTGPLDGPVVDPLDGDEEDGTPEIPGPIDTSDPLITPVPEVPVPEAPGIEDPVPGDPVIEDPVPGDPVPGDPDTDDPGTDIPSTDIPGTDVPELPGEDNSGNDSPGNSGNPGNGNGNGNGNAAPEGTGNTNPGIPQPQPGAPEVGAPVRPGAPSLPENPPLDGPGTQPTAPAVNPNAPSPAVPTVEPVLPPAEDVGDRNADSAENPGDVTGWWGTLPEGWTLSEWIVIVFTGGRP